MAHGFLSPKDTRGQSGIERALEKYLDNKFNEAKKNIGDRIAQGFSKGFSRNPRDPKPYSSSRAEPLRKMLGGTALQGALPGSSSAVNPDIVGGGLSTGGFSGRPLRSEGFVSDQIIDIGATPVGVEQDSDMFVKRMEPVGGGSGEVVQAIDRLTFVTMGLVAVTKEQTANQSRIAQEQQQQSDKLARKAIAGAEESALEQGGNFSGNTAYEALATSGMGMMRGGRGGPGMGIGGKFATKKLLTAVGKRGGARAGTRLGIAMGSKMGRGLGKSLGKKLGGKAIGKIAGGALAKSLGKKIPLVGLGLGAIFAAQRAMQGDFLGAGLELASGAASTVPGIGTAGSIGIDAALAARDMTAMSEGGITDGPVNALIGERGKEGVFPLEGSEGKKTFFKFGEGIIDAQRRNKGLFGKIQAEGFKEYYDKQNGLARFGDVFASGGFFENLKEILGAITLPMGFKPFQFNSSEGDNTNDNSSIELENYGGGFGIKGLKVGRKNSGQDMRVNADGVFESKIGGVVTKIGEHKDLGQYVDIVNEERGVTERIADIAGVMPGIEVGASITPGMPVAKGNDAGIVHYEIRNGGNADAEKYKAKFGFGGTQNPNEFLEGISNVDNSSSSVLNTLSEDTSTSNSGGTTIINNITQASPTNNSSNQGSDVALGASASEMGAHALFATMALRA